MAAPALKSRHAGNSGNGEENPNFSETSRMWTGWPSSAARRTSYAVALAILAVVGAMLLAGALRRFGGDSDKICWRDFRTGLPACRRKCANGTFGLSGMDACVPWLTCADIIDLVVGQEIGSGAVKQVHLAFWNDQPVALANPVTVDNTVLYRSDFASGLSTLVALGPTEWLVQLVGFCHEPLTIVTEYHRMGSAALALEHLKKHDALTVRLQLCADYVDILKWLHATGPRVMCDSSTLAKTLQQYLLTDDMRLRLNDVDALPLVTKALIRCGDRSLDGEFVAPEQLWNGTGSMPLYDHRTDIWKIPDVCDYFLAGATDEDMLQFHLFGIHRKCKSLNPDHRPTAAEVLVVYQNILKQFEIQMLSSEYV